MALHHVKDPAGFLVLLRKRARRGGSLVVLDGLQKSDSSHVAERLGKARGYDPADMIKVSGGPKIWPGFTMDEIKGIMTASGCGDVDVREWPERLEFPTDMQAYDRMFIARATVL